MSALHPFAMFVRKSASRVLGTTTREGIEIYLRGALENHPEILDQIRAKLGNDLTATQELILKGGGDFTGMVVQTMIQVVGRKLGMNSSAEKEILDHLGGLADDGIEGIVNAVAEALRGVGAHPTTQTGGSPMSTPATGTAPAAAPAPKAGGMKPLPIPGMPAPKLAPATTPAVGTAPAAAPPKAVTAKRIDPVAPAAITTPVKTAPVAAAPVHRTTAVEVAEAAVEVKDVLLGNTKKEAVDRARDDVTKARARLDDALAAQRQISAAKQRVVTARAALRTAQQSKDVKAVSAAMTECKSAKSDLELMVPDESVALQAERDRVSAKQEYDEAKTDLAKAEKAAHPIPWIKWTIGTGIVALMIGVAVLIYFAVFGNPN